MTQKPKTDHSGDVFVHSSAIVSPSAVLGPNVSVGRGVKIGAGARVRESILLGNSSIGEHSLVIYRYNTARTTYQQWFQNSKIFKWDCSTFFN